MLRRFLIAVGVAGVAFLAAAGSSSAAPPQLLSVGQTNGHVTATWSLPPGVQAKWIEAATSPHLLDNGFFPLENAKLFSALGDAQTSFLGDTQLVPGTYYVHVAGHDTGCSCGDYEFTQILTVVIPIVTPPPPPTTPQPPPPPVKPKLKATKAQVGKAIGGKSFTVSMTVTNTQTGKGVKGQVSCTGRLGGKPSPTSHRSSTASGKSSCSWQLPTTAHGKRFTGAIAATYRGAKISRTFSAKVA
jgi:hypothetical protein